MNEKLRGVVEVTFVMGGLSKEKSKPYLQISNGIEAKFAKLHKDFPIAKDTFSDYEKGDVVRMEVETDGIEIVFTGIAE